MNEEQMKAWVANPNRADTLPSGFYEPAYRKGITGAALVVRGVVYFRDGYTSAVRAALVKCFEQYNATIVEYAQALARVRQEEPPKNGPLRWFYSEGEQPAPIDKASKLATLAKRVPSDEALVVQMTSADHKLATGFLQFRRIHGRRLESPPLRESRRTRLHRPADVPGSSAWGIPSVVYRILRSPSDGPRPRWPRGEPSPHGARGKRGNRICLCSPIRPRNRRRRSDGLQHGEIGRQDQNRGLDRRLGQEPRARRRRTGFMDFASRLVRSSAAGCRWVDHPSRRRAASRHFGWPWQTTAAAARLPTSCSTRRYGRSLPRTWTYSNAARSTAPRRC